jgi:hypothetical protein
MDIVNLLAYSGANFVMSKSLTPWADLYDLADGKFRAQMRVTAESSVVVHEWSTDAGSIDYDETTASGSIAFTLNPANAKTITLGAASVTFVTSGATGNQVNIGATLGDTLSALLTLLAASTDPEISKCSYSIAGTDLDIEFDTTGTLGNSFAIATNVSGATASGITLSGAGGLVTFTSPITDIRNFRGTYAYDCRWEFEDEFIPLFGGQLEFRAGVTRTDNG